MTKEGDESRTEPLPDIAVEVVDALPILLVDGDASLSPESSTYFFNKALAQSPDPKKPPQRGGPKR